MNWPIFILEMRWRSDNFEMVFWCLRFPTKNEQKQVNLRYHSSKVEILRMFFWGNQRHQKPFWNYVTFTIFNISNWNYRLADDSESDMIQIVWLDKKFYRILQSWLQKEYPLFCTVLYLASKLLYISCVVSNFHETEFEIWAGFGPVGITEKCTN